MDHLCRAYWYPLYAFARRQGHAPEDAGDLTQEFFAQLLARGGLKTATPERGRFRKRSFHGAVIREISFPNGNPVTFSWCVRADGSVACVVAELSNTFGERLPEVLRGPGPEYGHDKRLHVSPFMGLDQSYEYWLSEPAADVTARIHVRENGGLPLTAVLHCRRRELTNASVAAALLRYPIQPLQVTGLIHWQAIRLWRKRVPFHRKPPFVPGEGSVRS